MGQININGEILVYTPAIMWLFTEIPNVLKIKNINVITYISNIIVRIAIKDIN